MSTRKAASAFCHVWQKLSLLWHRMAPYRLPLLIAFGLLWTVGAAQNPDLDTLLSWEQFLTWLSTPSGITTVAGAILSIFFEYIPHYDQLSKKLKRVVFAAVCVFVPVVGASLGVLTLAWPPGWAATFWPAIITGVYVFGVGTLAHTPRLKDAPEPAPADPPGASVSAPPPGGTEGT